MKNLRDRNKYMRLLFSSVPKRNLKKRKGHKMDVSEFLPRPQIEGETSMELGKVPPHDIEAEQAVIGSMLTDKDAVMLAVERLKSDNFYRDDNKAIFEAMINLYSKSEPVDLITVKDELESMGLFDKIGGMEYLALLPAKVPTTANAQKYITIVQEKATLRNLIKTANEIIELGYDGTEDVEEWRRKKDF